jgi:ANTAR domain/GAF domain
VDRIHNQDGGQDPSPMEEGAAYAELSQIALVDRPLEQTLEEVAVLAKRVLRETPEASVTLLSDDEARTAAYSGDLALRLDEQQYADGHGPCLDASLSGGAIQVSIDDPETSYPDFCRAAHQYGVTHSLSVGMPASGRIIGALNLYSLSQEPFTDDSARIAGTFAGFAGMALSIRGGSDDAARAAAQLQQALRSRAVISQAQGILMARQHFNRDQAFAALVQLAQQQGLRLQQIAQQIVDQEAG